MMRTLACCLAAFLLFGPATAPVAAQDDGASQRRPDRPRRQRRQRPQQLSVEQAETVWKAQAMTFASTAGLDASATATMITAYVQTRQARRDAIATLGQQRQRDARDTGQEAAPETNPGDRRDERRHRAKRSREIDGTHRDALRGALAPLLDGETLESSVKLLGSFSRQWDMMVHTVLGFDLPADKSDAALKALQDYTLAVGGAERDRSARGAARRALHTALEGVLSAEQIEKLTRGNRRRGGDRARSMEDLDTNGDGLIQRDEVPERMSRFFDRLDANDDGVLDETEMEAAGQRRGRSPEEL